MKKIFIIIIFVICGFIAWYYLNHKTIYGNDVESIIERIESNKLYENSNIEIIDINDSGEYRIVAFLSNDNPSYIRFRNDGKGNYKFLDSETRSNVDFSNFIIPLHNKESVEILVLNVKNSYSNVTGLNFKANNDLYEIKFEDYTKNARWTKLKDSDDNEYRFEWFPIESKN